jgi:hypothetical protein
MKVLPMHVGDVAWYRKRHVMDLMMTVISVLMKAFRTRVVPAGIRQPRHVIASTTTVMGRSMRGIHLIVSSARTQPMKRVMI